MNSINPSYRVYYMILQKEKLKTKPGKWMFMLSEGTEATYIKVKYNKRVSGRNRK